MPAYPAATAEAWIDGHVHAFTFFGKVPASILCDNDRCLVAKILPVGTRKRATLFSGFLSLYLFRDRYGRPGKVNEKGNAEGLVGYSRRNFMVPILGLLRVVLGVQPTARSNYLVVIVNLPLFPITNIQGIAGGRGMAGEGPGQDGMISRTANIITSQCEIWAIGVKACCYVTRARLP